jgi:hypothetical protein
VGEKKLLVRDFTILMITLSSSSTYCPLSTSWVAIIDIAEVAK